MDAALGTPNPRLPRESPGPLRIEVGSMPVAEIAELYRALALICVEQQITRLDHDPAGERSLRNAMTTMVLAGIPAGFRLALVAASPRVVQTYRTAQRDFNAAGITTGLFEGEDDATRWLA